MAEASRPLVRALIADRLPSFVSARLKDASVEAAVEPGLADDALTRRLEEDDPEILVVRSTKVAAADLEAAPSLTLVVRAGSGVNTIDVAAASRRGIYVANCPGKNAAAVAELTIGHLINLDRRIADNVAAMRAGRWEKKTFGRAPGLRGRTLAVLGCGTIGREVIALAKAFGMHVVGWSRSLSPEAAAALGVAHAPTPERAVEGAHAVTVHLALNDETRARIGDSVFSAMKPGAYFINTSRGEVVDEAALLEAIAEKKIRAGLDVFADEPASGQGSFEAKVAADPHVYGTHHIGASTRQAKAAVGEEVLRIVGAYLRGAPIPNCVNLARETNASHTLVVRHADQLGVLAHILDVLREDGHNVEEMQNIVFSGATAACARISIVGSPSRSTLERIRSHDHVHSALATLT